MKGLKLSQFFAFVQDFKPSLLSIYCMVCIVHIDLSKNGLADLEKFDYQCLYGRDKAD